MASLIVGVKAAGCEKLWPILSAEFLRKGGNVPPENFSPYENRRETMSYTYRIPQGRDKDKRTNDMLPVRRKLESVLSALANGEKLMQVRLWQNWEMVMGPEIAPLAWPLGARNDILIVGGEDNLALQELSFMTPEILERVNAFMDAPAFAKVELRLVMGDRPLDRPPDIQPTECVRPAPPRPGDLGGHLEDMRPDSPVARCYAAYLRMHGVLPPE